METQPHEISAPLSASVRASITLATADRPLFVGQHLLAQVQKQPLPVATSAASLPLSRVKLQEELSALAELLTTALNAVSGRPGPTLQHLANYLIAQQGIQPDPAAAASSAIALAGAPEADGIAGKGKKTARFAAAGGPERVGEPPKEMVKVYSGGKSADGFPEGHGTATYANGDLYEGEWKVRRSATPQPVIPRPTDLNHGC